MPDPNEGESRGTTVTSAVSNFFANFDDSGLHESSDGEFFIDDSDDSGDDSVSGEREEAVRNPTEMTIEGSDSENEFLLPQLGLGPPTANTNRDPARVSSASAAPTPSGARLPASTPCTDACTDPTSPTVNCNWVNRASDPPYHLR